MNGVAALDPTLWDLQLVITGNMTGVSAMLLRGHPCVVAGGQVQEPCRASQEVWIKGKKHLQGPDLLDIVVIRKRSKSQKQ